jgi:hypothetical protein
MRDELHARYNNPYPIETAIFELESKTSLSAEVTRSLFHTARDYTESFCVYGERMTFEWEQIEGENPVIFRMQSQEGAHGQGNTITWERIEVPDRQDLLPPEIARYTQRGVYNASQAHRSFLQGGGHGGAHPHMVHEFVSSIVEGCQPWPDAVTSANWGAPGICAHESAMRGGERVEIPCFMSA